MYVSVKLTQGMAVAALRRMWADRTGGKLESWASEMGVEVSTARKWINETMNPSLAQWALMEKLAGSRLATEYLNELSTTNHPHGGTDAGAETGSSNGRCAAHA